MDNELSRVVDALPGLMWTALHEGQIDFVNLRWCEYTGLGLREASGTGWQTVIHPQDLPGLLERWRAMLATGEPRDMEARMRRFDGAYRWFLFRVSPLTDASGRLAKWCGMNTDIEDRRQDEEALRASEHRLDSIVDGLPALVSLLRPNGEIEHCNSIYLDYFGLTLDEAKRQMAGHSCHPDDAPMVLAAWRKSLEQGLPCDLENRRRRADGAYRWFRSRGFPLRDAQGHIVLWYFLQIDIDDAKRAEALLAGEKGLLEMVARGVPMPAILEALCQLVESAAGGSHCGVVLVDASGTRLEHGAAPSLPASFIAAINGLPVDADSGPCSMSVHLNEQVIAADIRSETRWAASAWCPMALAHGLQACWSTPISSTAGKVLGAFAIYYDEPKAPTSQQRALIDQFTHIASIAIGRAQSDAALRRSEVFLAETRRLSSTGGFSKRVATGAIIWSEEVYRMFELDPAVPVTLERILTRIHPEDVHTFQDMLDMQRDGKDYEHEYRLLMPDQSVKYLHVVSHGSRDREGELEYIAAIQDVTQRRLAEEALAEARSELAHVARATTLGVLTASIAHEVNQPLSGIITNASTCLRMLAADPPDLDGARETARRTIRDGNRASDVISRLRSLFAKQDGRTELVDLNEAASEVIALSLSELHRARVILRMELADDLPPVAGDRVQLQQVILNLLLNASEAMRGVDDRPRHLVIRSEREHGDRARMAVQDAGIGFGPHGAEKLFEAFYTTKNGGMGIGLSVSRSIIESHQGRLWAAANEGSGATFSFSIPGKCADGASATSSGGVRTLAVTDDA
ncbi:MAG: PAS domain-containing protein [Caldimonas sp.]